MLNYLLPFPYKIAGLVLTVIGIAFALISFWFPLELQSPVFAFYSSFLEEKYFTIIRNNLADELIMLLLLSGAGLMVFSKEKNEFEGISLIRGRALFRALLMNAVINVISVVFIYGSGFIYALLLNLVMLQWLYLLNLRYLLHRSVG